MYLWRNLPKGQLSAVLRWVRDARTSTTPVTGPHMPPPLPAAPLSTASLSDVSNETARLGETLPR